jgi:prephenate dehydratase
VPFRHLQAFEGPSGVDQTVLSFEVGGSSPGELSDALKAFQDNKVNLREIQSLPLLTSSEAGVGCVPREVVAQRFSVGWRWVRDE